MYVWTMCGLCERTSNENAMKYVFNDAFDSLCDAQVNVTFGIVIRTTKIHSQTQSRTKS